jgi:2-keto-4-pentenoate hydratase/2-oxohepta-3-ene-1,7-dioic acid hydratase in catechol pathway
MKLEFVGGTTDHLTIAPSKIIGIGQNYRAHAAEMGKGLPEEPLMFMKPPSAIIASGGEIARPVGFDRVDYEGELGVIIGTIATRVRRTDALRHVLGYTCINDVTVRDLQKKDGQWIRAKGFDGFCPMGPRVVAGLDPTNLRITTRVNGVVRQDSTTADLIFDVATLVAFVSHHMTLLPGDVISTLALATSHRAMWSKLKLSTLEFCKITLPSASTMPVLTRGRG